MIKYTPFFETIKQKGITTYALRHKHNISNGTLYRMRQNKPLSTETLNALCNAIKCKIEEIIVHEPDND